ncbi:hypothetical protein [Methyloprofundus sp.]|uniref:hypothetical protein n=1 Tax=Methyloprofundus sp. TaxID=2020875 RepID=UPI003D11106B
MTLHKILSLGSFKILMLFFLPLLNACTHTVMPVRKSPQSAELIRNDPDKAWYAARLSFNWEQGQVPDWYLGTLIAGEVIAPLLPQYVQQITCWRVHRRAVRDQTGHVFSFIFYSSKASAALIYQQLKENKVLAELQARQRIIKISYDLPAVGAPSLLADTSDPVWPATMRASWPYFMMGASQMWMVQLQNIKDETTEIDAVEQRYQTIQNKLTEQWQEQGQHALIHHLSALYAYQPVPMRF